MAAIIFDFDGTISDSFEYIVDFLAAQAKLPPLSKKQKQELRGHSMVGIARLFGHPWWRMLRLFRKGRWRMARAMKRVEPFDGMPEVIAKLHAEGHELFIISNNTTRNVHIFLHNHKLHEYFLEVYGGVGLFGKAPVLRKLLREHQLERQNCIYIGDELRDVQAAQSIDMRAVAVTWGFARPIDLEALRPTDIADSPARLMKILEEL